MSASPFAITKNPIPITMNRADISIRVRKTLNFTLSPTPRRLTTASNSMNRSATTVMAVLLCGRSTPMPSRPTRRLVARRLADVDALVMPEQITAKATRNVTKWIPNALCA